MCAPLSASCIARTRRLALAMANIPSFLPQLVSRQTVPIFLSESYKGMGTIETGLRWPDLAAQFPSELPVGPAANHSPAPPSPVHSPRHKQRLGRASVRTEHGTPSRAACLAACHGISVILRAMVRSFPMMKGRNWPGLMRPERRQSANLSPLPRRPWRQGTGIGGRRLFMCGMKRVASFLMSC
jgi:hypothetical protein